MLCQVRKEKYLLIADTWAKTSFKICSNQGFCMRKLKPAQFLAFENLYGLFYSLKPAESLTKNFSCKIPDVVTKE